MLTSLAMFATLSIPAPPASPAQVPQPIPRIRLADYLPPLADGSRDFEERRAFLARNGEDDLPWTPPQVEITAGEDLSRTALSVAFNWVWLGQGEARRPVWFARLRAMNLEGAVERFADSRTCPGVEESLRRLEALPLIDPRVPALPDPGAPPDPTELGALYLHDNTYGVRLRGLSEGGVHSFQLQANGGSGTVFAPVIAETLSRLKPCWTDSPPPRR